MTFDIASRSHPGKRRRKNEDAFLVQPHDDFLVLAVADGVGGERGGEVASHEAMRALTARFARQEHLADPALAIANSILAANDAVYARASGDRRLRGMATTVVAAIVTGARAWIANVGDSRAYLVDDAQIRQITQDHSLVAEGVRLGRLTSEDAIASGARHVITRSVGSGPSTDVDVFGPLDLNTGETLLLCSDGLSDVVADVEIHRIVAATGDLDAAAETLVARANAAGGPDNITVVLYRHTLTRGTGRAT